MTTLNKALILWVLNIFFELLQLVAQIFGEVD